MPSIELMHPVTPQPAMRVSNFMSEMISQVSGVFEMMVAHICNKNAQAVAGLPIQVIELPEDWQRAQHVRFSYGVYDGDRAIPAG